MASQQTGRDETDFAKFSQKGIPGYVCLIQKVESTGSPKEDYQIVVIKEEQKLPMLTNNVQRLMVKERVSSMHDAELMVCKAFKTNSDTWFKYDANNDIKTEFSEKFREWIEEETI